MPRRPIFKMVISRRIREQTWISGGHKIPFGRGMSPTRRDYARLAWCATGAAAALGVALWLTSPNQSPLFLASLGGSAVFLFGLTGTSPAQPRALFGGHLGGAMIGILCWIALGDGAVSYAVAIGFTLLFMLTCRVVHPPAGATPLIMIHGHASFAALWQPVGLSILVLALAAAVWSRLTPGLRPYPMKWLERSPASLWQSGWTD